MPYRRSNRTYRRRYRRKFSGRRYRSVRRIVRRVIAKTSETKFYRQTVTLQQPYVSNALVYSFADNISLGTGNANRIGNQIRVQRYTFRLAAQQLNTSSSGGSVRVSLVYPRKGISADANWILTNSNIGVVQDFDPATTFVLYDQIFFIEASNPTTFNGATPSVRYFRYSKRCFYTFNYSNSVIHREPILIIQSNNTTLATAPYVNGYLRISYKDL